MITKIKSLNRIRGCNEPGTLLVLDLDDTVIWTPDKTPAWTSRRKQQLIKQGLTPSQADNTIQREINHPSNVKLVEKVILDIINNCSNVIALTARHGSSHTFTVQQLEHVGIKFPLIIYSDTIEKGKVLYNYLQTKKIKPKKIVFVDNMEENCVSVNKWFPNSDCYYYLSKTDLDR